MPEKCLSDCAQFSPVKTPPLRNQVSADAIIHANIEYKARRKRDLIFREKSKHFGEPAWDILLDLFIAFGQGRDVTVSSACIGASSSTTTALRSIRALVAEGLIIRQPDVFDRRRTYLHLSPNAVTLIQDSITQFSFPPVQDALVKL